MITYLLILHYNTKKKRKPDPTSHFTNEFALYISLGLNRCSLHDKRPLSQSQPWIPCGADFRPRLTLECPTIQPIRVRQRTDPQPVKVVPEEHQVFTGDGVPWSYEVNNTKHTAIYKKKIQHNGEHGCKEAAVCCWGDKLFPCPMFLNIKQAGGSVRSRMYSL